MILPTGKPLDKATYLSNMGLLQPIIFKALNVAKEQPILREMIIEIRSKLKELLGDELDTYTKPNFSSNEPKKLALASLLKTLDAAEENIANMHATNGKTAEQIRNDIRQSIERVVSTSEEKHKSGFFKGAFTKSEVSVAMKDILTTIPEEPKAAARQGQTQPKK